MKRFSDFCKEQNLQGKKVSINKLANKEIEVINYRLTSTKFSSNCAQIQFRLLSKDTVFVTFTSSKIIIRQLTQYKDELPFIAFIKSGKSKNGNSYYTFS